jgi:hypothetical protein
MAAGTRHRDELARTGSRDAGARPPITLRVEAADTVIAAGQAVGSHAV